MSFSLCWGAGCSKQHIFTSAETLENNWGGRCHLNTLLLRFENFFWCQSAIKSGDQMGGEYASVKGKFTIPFQAQSQGQLLGNGTQLHSSGDRSKSISFKFDWT